MSGRGGLGLALLGLLSAGAQCGGEDRCPPQPGLPTPMTAARARALDPSLRVGLALSVTHATGDCRPRPVGSMPPADPCLGPMAGLCDESRAALRVLVVPSGRSVPLDESCPNGFAVTDVAARAAAAGAASAAGEWVSALPPGSYAVLLSADGRCAACGAGTGLDACVVTVPPDGIVSADLLLDEAAR